MYKDYFSVFHIQYQTVTEFEFVKLCLNDKKICLQRLSIITCKLN